MCIIMWNTSWLFDKGGNKHGSDWSYRWIHLICQRPLFCKDFLSTFLQKQFADLFVIEASFSSSQSGIFSTFIQQTFFSQHLIAARPTNQTFRKLIVFVLYRHLSTSCCYKPGLFKISGLLRITTNLFVNCTMPKRNSLYSKPSRWL